MNETPRIPHGAHGFDVLPCVERRDETGPYIERPHEGETPQFWGVYSFDAQGHHTHLDDFPTEVTARDHAAVLQAQLDAASSYRKRYYESATYRRAVAREAWRFRAARARLLFVAILAGLAWVVAQMAGGV